MADKITSADVRAALLLRYPAESHALMFEVAPRTGGGTRYADAVSVGLWASHGHRIEGFEIKVARSDWLNELKQPEKSEPVMRYCNHWWLACPKGMANIDELPTNWGLLELQNDGKLRVRVQASKLDPVPITLGFFASLVRRGVEADNDVLQKALQRESKIQHTRIRETLERERTRELSAKQQQALDAIARLDALKEKTGIDFSSYHYTEGWFAAVELLHSLNQDWGRGALAGVKRDLLACVETIDKSGLLAKPLSEAA